jgi:hypothetical protein
MKATIAARLCGIDVEIRGDKPKNLADWLWDFEAHKLSDNDQKRVDIIAQPSHTGFNKTLYKTENFLKRILLGLFQQLLAHLGKPEYSNQTVYSELLPGLERRSVVYMEKIPMSLQGSIVFWTCHWYLPDRAKFTFSLYLKMNVTKSFTKRQLMH